MCAADFSPVGDFPVLTVSREVLLRHLRRIHCHGEIPEVAVYGGLGGTAHSYSKDLAVFASDLVGVPPLPGGIGIRNLGGLLARLGSLEGESLTLEVRAGRELIATGSNGRVRMLIGPPDLVRTSSPAILNALRARISDLAFQSFDPRAASTIAGAIGGNRNCEVWFRIGPAGASFVIGDHVFDFLELRLPEVRSDEALAYALPSTTVRCACSCVVGSTVGIATVGNDPMLAVRLEEGPSVVTYVLGAGEPEPGRRPTTWRGDDHVGA